MYEEFKSLYDWLKQHEDCKFAYVFHIKNELSLRISSNLSKNSNKAKVINEDMFREFIHLFSDKKPGARVIDDVVYSTWRTNMIGSEYIIKVLDLVLRKQLISNFLEERV